MTTLLKNARIVSPKSEIANGAVLIDEGRIMRVLSAGDAAPAADQVIDAGGKTLVPGFIDAHIHGGMGYEVTCDKPEAIETIAKAKLREGVTSFCPTTLTISEETLARSQKFIAAYRRNPTGSKVIGTHLEGPYINPKCVGAQNPAFVRKADIAEIKRLDAISPVSIITYAIEVEGNLEFTKLLRETHIVPSCGHTAATAAQMLEAKPFGLKRLTHFCNQMTKLHHREIGMVGLGLYDDDITIEIICDKIHVCPDMIRLTFKSKPIDRILLITDAMEATGLPDGNYQIGGLAVVVSDGAARLASDGALAGSTLKLDQALRNVLEVTGRDLPDIIQTTAWNQAMNLGINDLGKIEPGFVADLVLLDENLKVAGVFRDGQKLI